MTRWPLPRAVWLQPDAGSRHPSVPRALGSPLHTLPCLWRRSLALPLHLFLAASLALRSGDVCASPCMAGPAAERLTHRAFTLLSYGRIHSFGLNATVPKLSPMAECQAVLTYLQVGARRVVLGSRRAPCRVARSPPCCRPCHPPCRAAARSPPPQVVLGFLLPAIVHAMLETRLFTQHQQQRRRAGLAGESGWQATQAAVYRSLAGLLEVLAWPQAMLALGVLLSICFDLSLLAAGA